MPNVQQVRLGFVSPLCNNPIDSLQQLLPASTNMDVEQFKM
jgi:hypothetical protein